MTILDHNAYPHLIDAIFAAADARALLALRGASHAFQSRADARLFAHIAVHVADDVTLLRSPSASSFSFSSAPERLPGGGGENLPALPFPLVASRREQRALASKLAHARVVDLHSPIPVDYTAWGRTFDVVRRINPLSGSGYLLKAHTYVEYLDLTECEVEWRGRGRPMGDWIGEVPEGVRRSILHVKWRRGSREQVRKMGRVYFPRGDVVVLLQPDGGMVEGDKGTTEVVVSLLRSARRFARASSGVMTIVGLEKLDPQDLGDDVEFNDEIGEDYLSAVKSVVGRELDRRHIPSDRVAVVSWDEWRVREPVVASLVATE